MHAKGSGAYGTFTVTHDIMRFTKAKIFSKFGKQTPMFARFSTVPGERGAADAERDIRGFALKFYTEEGNWDVVGDNTPVFFFRGRIGAKNGQDAGANMKSVLSLAMFAAWALCFVAFVTKVRPAPVMQRLRRANRCESSDAFAFSAVCYGRIESAQLSGAVSCL
jgi:hypothetical protein